MRQLVNRGRKAREYQFKLRYPPPDRAYSQVSPLNKTALFDNCPQLEVIEHGPDTLGIKMAAKYKYLVSNERRHHDLDILILI